jgi:hypothetical protein
MGRCNCRYGGGVIVAGQPGLSVYGAGYIVKGSSGATALTVRVATNVAATETAEASRNFGARHNAAFVFASENRDSVVFVASEDGPVRCVTGGPDKTGVVMWPVRLPES